MARVLLCFRANTFQITPVHPPGRLRSRDLARILNLPEGWEHTYLSRADTADLLHAKLAPPRLRSPLVSRAALLDRLDASLDRKLTLLSAPAGFGKTTLVADN